MQFNYEKFNRARQQNHLLSGDEASSTEMLGLPVSSSAPDMDAQDRKDVTPQKTRGSSSTSLFSGKSRKGKGVERINLSTKAWLAYYHDIFHTLLNMPRHRFLAVFFIIYLSQYVFFAFFYLAVPDRCIDAVSRHPRVEFSHALWFSVQTSATLGYTGNMGPNPDCAGINMLIIIQVIVASLIDYCMMGLVFARFASPDKRSVTVRFSSGATLSQRTEDGLWVLAFRVANIRKHALLQPELSLLLALPDGGDSAGACFRFINLPLEDLTTQSTALKLGLPAIVLHVVRPGSPLWALSLDQLDALGAELLCFMEGMDPSTSNTLQAQHAYVARDIRMNERFAPIDIRRSGGALGIDFKAFDDTALVTRDELGGTMLMAVTSASSGVGPGKTDEVRLHMADLRLHTIESLTPLAFATPARTNSADANNADHAPPYWSAAGTGAGMVGGAGMKIADLEEEVKALCDALMTDSGVSVDLRRRAAYIRAMQVAGPAISVLPQSVGPFHL